MVRTLELNLSCFPFTYRRGVFLAKGKLVNPLNFKHCCLSLCLSFSRGQRGKRSASLCLSKGCWTSAFGKDALPGL